MTWEATPELVARDTAITNIRQIAREDGITGSFKVFYNDQLVADPANLPEQVDMSKVRVSAMLDNA